MASVVLSKVTVISRILLRGIVPEAGTALTHSTVVVVAQVGSVASVMLKVRAKLMLKFSNVISSWVVWGAGSWTMLKDWGSTKIKTGSARGVGAAWLKDAESRRITRLKQMMRREKRCMGNEQWE